MSDKRFVIKSTATELELYDSDVQIGEFPHFEWVAKSVDYVVDLLNKQEDTIITLKRRLEKINNGYGDLTHRNGLTANEWLIQSQEKELKKKDKQISEWIEQHSKDIAKISEQNKLIRNLKEENEKLLKQIAEYDCEDCINYKSYCFDEYDSDCYCSVFDELKYDGCEKYEKRSNDE